MTCPRCNGSGVVVTAGPDDNGMYDADDCPGCSAPVTRGPGYCPHGVYVGGVGIDWMCGRCEDGEQ